MGENSSEGAGKRSSPIMTHSQENSPAVSRNSGVRPAARRPHDQPFPPNPYRTLVILAFGVFSAEILVMLFLPYLRPMSNWSKAFLDSIMLLALLFPLLFFFSFRPLKRYLEERKAAEEAIRGSEKALRALLSRLIEVLEDERKETSRQLNEVIMQDLVAHKLKLGNAITEMGGENGAISPGLLEAVMSEFQETFEKIRSMAMDLCPVMLDDLGVIATISFLCRETETKMPKIQIEKKIDVEEHGIPKPLKIVIFRVMQEFFQRIIDLRPKGLVQLSLGRQDGSLLLTIEYEDGNGGSDPWMTWASTQEDEISQPPSMKERIELSGGTFLPDAPAPAIIRIRASWPLTESK